METSFAQMQDVGVTDSGTNISMVPPGDCEI